MAQPLGTPFSYFTDNNGLPLAGGKVYTYIAGTTTPQASYTNASGTTPASNPVVLDSAGKAVIWLQGYYKIIVTDAAGTVYPNMGADGITALSATGNMNTSIYDPANIQEQLVGLTAVQTLTNKSIPIVGVTTNSSAASGIVGEFVSADRAFGAAVALTTSTSININSFSLTAGDWDVTIQGYFTGDSGTTSTQLEVNISPTSATLVQNNGSFTNIGGSITNFSNFSKSCNTGPYRISLASTTTYYFVGFANYTGGNLSCYGLMRARRVR